MLVRKWGEVVQKAIELFVAMGDCYEAEVMIPVISPHLSAGNPINAGRGGKFTIPTNANPSVLDPRACKEMWFTEDFYHGKSVIGRYS
jgi:predicted aconitase